MPHTPTDQTAPAAAEQATAAWKDAERLQRWASGDHSDFYALAAEIEDTLYALHGLSITLRSQVAQYATGRTLYDDTHEMDPADRLNDATECLSSLASVLVAAQRYASGFHSAIGHIGAEMPT